MNDFGSGYVLGQLTQMSLNSLPPGRPDKTTGIVVGVICITIAIAFIGIFVTAYLDAQ